MIICNPGIKPKNKHLQSILASSKIRLLRLQRSNPVKEFSKQELIKTAEATLEGFYTANKKQNNEKLYILLHGWEGSVNSTYIQLLANTLYKEKEASIFRLNFRDHGETHHLNKGLFHSCRLSEIVDSIKTVTDKYPHKKIYLCGFSLGGNFCLRVAAKADEKKIKLTQIFAVSPPINPKNSMKAIEASSMYNAYFIKKWQKSLSKKQQLHPEIFDSYQFKQIKSLDKLTEVLIISHSAYNTTDEYFEGYQITDEIIDNINIPCHVITSWDDPVIPFKDYLTLEKKQNIKLVTTKHGGHCGFINSWTLHSWIEQYIVKNS
jgi:predicted alpha/beta-fold hydrolase